MNKLPIGLQNFEGLLGFPNEEVTYGMLENLLPVNQGTVL